MFDLLGNLAIGAREALSLYNLAFAFLGCFIGTMIGVLPGLGPLATVAMLMPLTFYMPPSASLIMLAGIYYGAQYGGSTTAILIRMPGESSSVVTCLDGHEMARRGRAGSALAIAALSSFLAGTLATLVIAAAATPLSAVGRAFESPEYFSLMVLGLVGAVVLANGSFWKSIAALLTGLLIGTVGTDLYTGVHRFTFGVFELSDGVGFLPVALGLFCLADIVANLSLRNDGRPDAVQHVTRLRPSEEELRAAWPAALRGTALGSVLGLLPGGGAMLSSFASYVLEKKIARDPSRFGNGAVEGLAGPEAANNAGAQTSFIPLLTLGMPSNALMALMVGALMIHGIAPGPQAMTQRPEVFWGLIVSMWVGNLMLLVINLPLIGIWVQMLKVPYRLMFAPIILFCAIGVYSVNNSAFEVLLAAGFGLLGLVFLKLGCEAAPLILAVVLGPMLEDHFRRAMLLSQGDLSVFVTRPLSLGLLLTTILLALLIALPSFKRHRKEAFE